jgi:hypothetical protein
MPDTGFELPLHKAEWAEFRNDPSKKSAGSSSKSGLKPSANAAAKKSSEFTLAHQFAGWSAPGIVRACECLVSRRCAVDGRVGCL